MHIGLPSGLFLIRIGLKSPWPIEDCEDSEDGESSSLAPRTDPSVNRHESSIGKKNGILKVTVAHSIDTGKRDSPVSGGPMAGCPPDKQHPWGCPPPREAPDPGSPDTRILMGSFMGPIVLFWEPAWDPSGHPRYSGKSTLGRAGDPPPLQESCNNERSRWAGLIGPLGSLEPCGPRVLVRGLIGRAPSWSMGSCLF